MKLITIRRVLATTLALVMCLGTPGGVGIPAVLSASAAPSVSLSIERKALELSVGETDRLVPSVEGGDRAVSFKSSDPAVVTVDAEGKLTAKKTGQATVTVSAGGEEVTCSVTVVESERTFGDEIMLTIFWPPTPEYITDEQFRLMAEAGITQVLGAGEGSLYSVEIQKKMLELCQKYGMGLTIADGSGWNHQSEDKIADLISRYHNVPAATGFYMVDEPWNPNQFVSTYVGIKKVEPNAYVHLNFLPAGPYGSMEIYKAQMHDYARLTAEAGYPLDYLMFDSYPFGAMPNTMERDGFFANLRAVHDVALKNGVGSGLYVQTVEIPGAFRRPEPAAIRYEMYLALAFGFKQLSFFTWFTPSNRSEPFADGIISADGRPNEHYEVIKQINSEIHALSPILAKCEALEVYFAGKNTYGQPKVPEDFFVQPGNPSSRFLTTYSFLRHKETGRNYLMVVNNHFERTANVELKFIDEITSISEVSRVDGSLRPLKLEDGRITLAMEAGDAMLIALPEGFDHYKAPEGQPAANVNLARDAIINASSSVGQEGYYIYPLNDGTRCTAGMGSEFAWRSVDAQDAYLKIDFGRVLDFNRVDLYPGGNLFSFGDTFPANVEVSVSVDGKAWQSVKTLTGLSVTENKATQVDLGKQTARYIRLDLKDIPEGQPYVSLNEIEVYCDDGTVPAPQELDLTGSGNRVITYKAGDNIALRKPAFASSTTSDAVYKPWGWSLSHINDGKTEANGWTSNVGRNRSPDSVEYVGMDFGDVFAVDKIVMVPLGYFPIDYVVELSMDGRNWTAVAEVKDAPDGNGGENAVFLLDDPVNARFLRVTATKLRYGGGDGYLFQLSEIEAYGTPVCDKTALRAALDVYKTEGGDMTAEAATKAEAALDNELLTQSQAKDLAKKLYVAIGYNEDGTKPAPETEPVTDPVTEPVTEPETEPTTEEETTVAMTGEDTEVETKATGKGCASSLMATATLALLLIGVPVLYKRRRKE